LPKGVYFVHTKQLGCEEHTGEASVATKKPRTSKKDSVVFVFRVAKANVLDELWKNYQEKNLDKKFQNVLMSSDSLWQVQAKKMSWKFSLEILFQEKDYTGIKRILQGNIKITVEDFE
jgi:hypothetical protein